MLHKWVCKGVVATTKIDIFKQITTRNDVFIVVFPLLLLPQR